MIFEMSSRLGKVSASALATPCHSWRSIVKNSLGAAFGAMLVLAGFAVPTTALGFSWEIIDVDLTDRTVQLRASEALSAPAFFQYDAIDGNGQWWDWPYLGEVAPRQYEFAVPEEDREDWIASPTCNLTDGGVNGEWGALGPNDFCAREFEDGWAVSIPCVYQNWEWPQP